MPADGASHICFSQRMHDNQSISSEQQSLPEHQLDSTIVLFRDAFLSPDKSDLTLHPQPKKNKSTTNTLPPLPEEWKRIWQSEREEWETQKQFLWQEREKLKQEEKQRAQRYRNQCKEYEELLAKERTIVQNKTQFFSNMVHEVRTQIVGLEGLVDLVKAANQLSEQQQEHLSCMKNCTNSLFSLISRFLDFTKIEAGKFELLSREFNLVAEIEEVAGMMSTLICSNVDLVVDIHPDVPLVVVGDQLSFRQTLTNFLSNAAKFTKSGEILIAASVLSKTGPKDCVIQFDIKDTGIGIDPPKLQQLFTPFVQADATIRKRFGGTGLGLAISKGLVESLGGTVNVQSTAGSGTTFSFTLPFSFGELQIVPIKADREPVCIIDSGNWSSIALQRFVSRYKFVPKVFSSPQAAFETIHTSKQSKKHKTKHPYHAFLIHSRHWKDWTTCVESASEDVKSAIKRSIIIVLSRPHENDFAELDCAVHRPWKQKFLNIALSAKLNTQPGAKKTKKLEPSALTTQFNFASMRVLVAEDNTVNQLIIRKQFSSLKCPVEIVSDGLEAMQALSSKEYDAIFVDCHMPNLDGYDVIAKLREREMNEPGIKFPVCALTADPCVSGKVFSAGFDDYLVKPVSESQLGQTIMKLAKLKVVPREKSLVPKKRRTKQTKSMDELSHSLSTTKSTAFKQLINDKPELLEFIGNHGDTILHMVCKAGNVSALKTLVTIDFGKTLPLKALDEQGNSCLHYLLSCQGSNDVILSMIEALWKTGFLTSLINQQNDHGETPLHTFFKRKNKYPNVVVRLLDLGADPNLVDNSGATLLTLAILSKSKNLVSTLIQYQADPTLGEPKSALQLAADDKEILIVLIKNLNNHEARVWIELVSKRKV